MAREVFSLNMPSDQSKEAIAWENQLYGNVEILYAGKYKLLATKLSSLQIGFFN